MILVLTHEEEDCDTLRGMLDPTYEIVRVRTREEVKEKLSSQQYPSVIICEACFPGGNWEDVHELAKEANTQPLVIVCTRYADNQLWLDVLNQGAHDVLNKPFRSEEVAHVVGFAIKKPSLQ